MQPDRARPKAPSQREILDKARRELFLDRRVPLAFPSHGHPEFGLSVTAFYARKHGPGGSGKGTYWPLHQVEFVRPPATSMKRSSRLPTWKGRPPPWLGRVFAPAWILVEPTDDRFARRRRFESEIPDDQFIRAHRQGLPLANR